MKDSDKSLEQLGILYGALRRLGFREPSVVESIGLSSQMDFAEFLDWVCSASHNTSHANTIRKVIHSMPSRRLGL